MHFSCAQATLPARARPSHIVAKLPDRKCPPCCQLLISQTTTVDPPGSKPNASLPYPRIVASQRYTISQQQGTTRGPSTAFHDQGTATVFFMCPAPARQSSMARRRPHVLDLLATFINSQYPQSSALPPMLPAVLSLHIVPAWQQLSTVGLVGRASNPSKSPVCRLYPPNSLCVVFIQLMAFLANEQSADGWRKGAWLCAGSSCPTNVKAAPDNAMM